MIQILIKQSAEQIDEHECPIRKHHLRKVLNHNKRASRVVKGVELSVTGIKIGKKRVQDILGLLTLPPSPISKFNNGTLGPG